MILCHCAVVSEDTVRRTIVEGASTVSEVSRRCGAARRCAPCREAVAEMILATNVAGDKRPPQLIPLRTAHAAA